MMTLIICFFVYCAFVIVNAGWFFAYFQGKYERLAKKDRDDDLSTAYLLALFGSLLGPIWMLMTYFMTNFAQYGWKLEWPVSRGKQDD